MYTLLLCDIEFEVKFKKYHEMNNMDPELCSRFKVLNISEIKIYLQKYKLKKLAKKIFIPKTVLDIFLYTFS